MARSQARCVVLACCAAVGAAQDLSVDLAHSWCFGGGVGGGSLLDTVGSMHAS